MSRSTQKGDAGATSGRASAGESRTEKSEQRPKSQSGRAKPEAAGVVVFSADFELISTASEQGWINLQAWRKTPEMGRKTPCGVGIVAVLAHWMVLRHRCACGVLMLWTGYTCA